MCRRDHLYVAVVVSSIAAEARVHQHSIQPINLRLSMSLRHVGPQVKILTVSHILGRGEDLLCSMSLCTCICLDKSYAWPNETFTGKTDLGDFATIKVGKTLQRNGEHIGVAVNA